MQLRQIFRNVCVCTWFSYLCNRTKFLIKNFSFSFGSIKRAKFLEAKFHGVFIFHDLVRSYFPVSLDFNWKLRCF